MFTKQCLVNKRLTRFLARPVTSWDANSTLESFQASTPFICSGFISLASFHWLNPVDSPGNLFAQIGLIELVVLKENSLPLLITIIKNSTARC